jgi:hypothetical protein
MARKRRPWNDPGHPAPLTSGRPRRGHPRLWDREQAAAYAEGRPIPALPKPGDPLDLLDLAEAAELTRMTPATWARYEHHERTTRRASGQPPLVPQPDETVCGIPHWYRRTVEQFRADRAGRARAPRGGRPRGATDRIARGETAARVAELLRQARARGESVSIAEIARQLGINYKTAHTHVHRLTDAAVDQ